MPDPTPVEILASLKDSVLLNGRDLVIGDKKQFREKHLDRLTYLSVFHEEEETRGFLRWLIRTLAQATGIVPASIHSFYRLKGEGRFPKVTVPAINIRGLTYDTARALIRAAKANSSMTCVFEIAASEMIYTDQSPAEYATVIMAAALREGWFAPIFIQGDHFQFKAAAFQKDPGEELRRLKEVTEASVEAGFYNIDIDASTLVDLEKASLAEQQKDNYEMTAEMTRFIRSIQPEGVTISVGGEIGEVGGKNSTVDELRAFMDGYIRDLSEDGKKKMAGLAKVSVQSGTVHGGIPLPDGKVADVAIDFATLKELGKIAKSAYKLGGVVQHGASTLPEELFERFPEADTAEIHLATAFQNLIFDGGYLPAGLMQEMETYLKKEFGSEREKGESDEQFFYKTRKKAFGPFKRKLWDLPDEIRTPIFVELQKRFDLIFKKLKAVKTIDAIVDNVETVKVAPSLQDKFRPMLTR